MVGHCGVVRCGYGGVVGGLSRIMWCGGGTL